MRWIVAVFGAEAPDDIKISTVVRNILFDRRQHALVLIAQGAAMGRGASFAVPMAIGIAIAACTPMLAADVASTAGTGKGTTEHALDAITGKDCRILEGAARADRRICEERKSAATERDFKGVRLQ